jgi:hypothetical protein
MVREYTKYALQEIIGWMEFENICTDYLFCQHDYTNIRQAGRVGDGGRDAVVLYDKEEAIVFAFSMEKEPISGTKSKWGTTSKFFIEYNKWKDKDIIKFVFVSNQDLGAKKIDLPKELRNPSTDIFDITDVVRFLDLTQKGNDVKRVCGINDHLEPSVVKDEQGDEEEIIVSNNYTMLSFKDFSHGAAKRFSANIIVNGRMTKSHIKEIIKKVNDNLRGRDYYKTGNTNAMWTGTPAHVVWLFIYGTLDDVANINWICRTQWLSDSLASEFTPMILVGNDEVDKIIIEWNDEYLSKANLFKTNTIEKEVYLELVETLLEQIKKIVSKAIKLTKEFESRQIVFDDYLIQMKTIEPILTEIYITSGNIGLPPIECESLDQVFQGLMAFAHNIVLPFSEKGLLTWPNKKGVPLVKTAIKGYLKEIDRFEFEREKVL